MSARLAQPGAASHDHLHGDEHLPRELDAVEQQHVDARTDELIEHRLTEGPRFVDLLAGIEPSSYEPYLHRAVLGIEDAIKGDEIAIGYVSAAVRQIANVVRAEARIVWREECEEIAERELTEGREL